MACPMQEDLCCAYKCGLHGREKTSALLRCNPGNAAHNFNFLHFVCTCVQLTEDLRLMHLHPINLT